MARYINYKCTKCDKNKFNSARVIGIAGDMRIVKCEGCGFEETQPVPRTIAKSLRYPYYNDSLKTRVTSKDHEEHIAKENGYVKIQDWNGGD